MRGVLLWNVWEQVEAARQLIAEPGRSHLGISKGGCRLKFPARNLAHEPGRVGGSSNQAGRRPATPTRSIHNKQKIMAMKHEFEAGDHVEWNSDAGHVRGTIKKKVTSAIKFKTYTVRASKEEPQYLIKSDKTDQWRCTKVRL